MKTDSKKRSLLKGLTWRVTASICTMALVLVFTGSLEFMVGIGLCEVVSKFVLYYFHERTWESILWGKKE